MLWRITWQAIIAVIACALLLASFRVFKKNNDRACAFFCLRPVAYIRIDIGPEIKMDPKKGHDPGRTMPLVGARRNA